MAMLVLLESLSPTERAVFLLREVFDYDFFSAVAEIVGKSEVNCRQILARAKEHISTRRPKFESSPEKCEAVLQRFSTPRRRATSRVCWR